MNKLSRNDLWSLEEYAERRPAFRQQVLAHKKLRQVALGEHARLYFEDRLTIQYQIQEMLRIERVFEAAGIEEELDAYNPLIGDGCNWKATFMIEYEDVAERQEKLAQLQGIEDKVWARVDGFDKVFPIADEDMDRSTMDKTSAVHFLRFELTAAMIHGLKAGAGLAFGCDHPAYPLAGDVVPDEIRESLLGDLDDALIN